MGRFGIALVLVSLALAASNAQTPRAQSTAERELLTLNRALLESTIVRREASLFEDLALPQFLVIPPGGLVETREEAIAGLSAFNAEAVSITDEQAIIQDQTAVVIARVQIAGEVRPVGRLGPMRIMTVFVRTDGEWRLLARSATPCLEMTVARGRC